MIMMTKTIYFVFLYTFVYSIFVTQKYPNITNNEVITYNQVLEISFISKFESL